MHQRCRAHTVAVATAMATLVGSRALAGAAPIYGGPTYDAAANTGYKSQELANAPGGTAGNGTGVGSAEKLINNTNVGFRAVRWDATGAAVELGNLGTDSSGRTTSSAYAVNSAGTAVGDAERFSGNTDLGRRAVRWDASGTVATELDNLGTGSDGSTFSTAVALNASGAAVGFADGYSAGTNIGSRAVRWDASGTAATELGNLGTDSSGSATSAAYAINDAGTAVGYAIKYSNGTDLGERAVRWSVAGAATELGNLSGSAGSRAVAVNAAGTAVGFSEAESGDTFSGTRAVRWDASGTTPTALDTLGFTTGGTQSMAWAINDAGTAVGYVGTRALRWDASGAATELQSLDPANADNGITAAYDINNAGTAVGTCLAQGFGARAVAWKADGVAIDLNTFLSASDAAQWRLVESFDISDTNWVTGKAAFDPDGSAGPMRAYTRLFLLDVISAFGTPGDATRDGSVNFDDLVKVAQNYNVADAATWDGGDFTGDGVVNFDDLVVLAQHYNTGAAVGDLPAGFAADWALAQSLAPEPTTLLTFAFSIGLMRRRRARRSGTQSRVVK